MTHKITRAQFQEMVQRAKQNLSDTVITNMDDLTRKHTEYNPKKPIIHIYPQARVLRYKDLYTLFKKNRPFLPLLVAVGGEKPMLYTFIISFDGFPTWTHGHYFFLMGMDKMEYYLYVDLAYENEPVKARINDTFYDRLYFFPKTKKRRFPKSYHPTLPTIYEKPPLRSLQRYDILPSPSEQQRSSYPKNVLIICGMDGYILKKTSEYIKFIFPNEPVNIINTGQSGSTYFMLDQMSHLTWPVNIPPKYDLIIFEHCPIVIYKPENLRFLYSKLFPRGLILFMYIRDMLLNRTQFQKFIRTTEAPGFKFFDYIMSQQIPTPRCANLPKKECIATKECAWIRKEGKRSFCGKKKVTLTPVLK